MVQVEMSDTYIDMSVNNGSEKGTGKNAAARKKLDLMQSMGNGREDWDTTYHFLMSLWKPINRLPEDRQMFLRMKIQEIIFQETQKEKGTQSQMQLFNCEDGRSNQG